MPNGELPVTRLPLTPPSPPKNPGNIKDIAQINSPMPSVIMAKGVPDFFTVTEPKIAANTKPVKPPTIGTILTGKGNLPALIILSVWIAMNAPNPE